jgi:predicted transglutaminase-like cysteine proteinase
MKQLYKISVMILCSLLVSSGATILVCAEQNASSQAPGVYVSGIISGASASAIVNGKLVRAGSTVGTIKIISINGDDVVYEYSGQRSHARLGAGALKRSPLAYTAREREVTVVESKEERSDLFKKRFTELSQSAQDNYEKAKEAYGKGTELQALQYYDAAIRDAQGAYAYTNETQRRTLQKFMNTCSAHINEIRGQPSSVTDFRSYNLKSPKEISAWLTTHIIYKTDQKVHDVEDYWQSPAETIILESGDCEDFAFLAQAFLDATGISSQVVMIANKDNRKGHALCVFSRSEGYDCFDGPSLYVMNKESIEELVNTLYPDYIIEGRYTDYVSHFIIFDLYPDH